VAVQGVLCAVLMFSLVAPASAIPAFARKYSLRCSACHESWPVLNDFGRSFRDNGYQLRLGRDDTVTAEPGYWPVAVRITPSYQYSKTTNVDTDQGPQTITSGGVADAGMDLLMAGTLTQNISFLVVPTGFASDGAVNLESYWAYFSRPLFHSDWFNVRIGQFEVDLPASSHRPMSLTSGYLMYSYHPNTPTGDNRAGYDMGENQRGIEFVGHDELSMMRYSLSVFTPMDSFGTQSAFNSASYFGHVQRFFRVKNSAVSEFEVGLWGGVANYPTAFPLTSGGEPIPGTGSDTQQSTRYGFDANLWLGHGVAPLHLNLVYGSGTDKQGLYGGAADRNGTWNGGFLEAIWVPPTDNLHWGVFGRYDMIRNKDQPLVSSPSNLNDQDQWTLGARYTIAYSIRDEVAFHAELSSLSVKGAGAGGLDQKIDTLMLGVDFAY
jgi:hypothetical protein